MVQDALFGLVRRDAQRLLARAIDLELRYFREHLVNGHAWRGGPPPMRNGLHPERLLQTGIGPVRVRIPKLRSRGSSLVFRSVLVPQYLRCTRAPGTASAELYLHAISSSDLDQALMALVGPRAYALPPEVRAELRRYWRQRCDRWRNSALERTSGSQVWWQALRVPVPDGTDTWLLVVIGIDERRRHRLLALHECAQPSEQGWRDVMLALKLRGMDFAADPAAIAALHPEGASGLGVGGAAISPLPAVDASLLHQN